MESQLRIADLLVRQRVGLSPTAPLFEGMVATCSDNRQEELFLLESLNIQLHLADLA